MHSPWLTEAAAEELLPRAVLSTGEMRDVLVAVLALFQIDATPVGAAGFTHPDSVDDRDGPLIDTILDLVQARFPLEGSPAADAFARNAERADVHSDDRS